MCQHDSSFIEEKTYFVVDVTWECNPDAEPEALWVEGRWVVQNGEGERRCEKKTARDESALLSYLPLKVIEEEAYADGLRDPGTMVFDILFLWPIT